MSSQEHDTGFPSLWIQFVVANVGGGDRAEDVKVVVVAVRRPDGTRISIQPSALKWSGVGVSTSSLERGTQRHLDVAHVLWPPKPGNPPWSPPWPASAAERAMGALVLSFWPRVEHDSRIVLDPGIYEIELEVTAHNLPATRYVATLELRPLDNAWDFAEHPSALVITPLGAALPVDGPTKLRVEGPKPVVG